MLLDKIVDTRIMFLAVVGEAAAAATAAADKKTSSVQMTSLSGVLCMCAQQSDGFIIM